MTDDYAISPSVVSPDVEGTAQALGKFLELKERILKPDDMVIISSKKYIKRSGWRKIALAFNVTTEIVSVERDYSSDFKVCHVKARAIAPNGRISEEIASCDSLEFTGNIKFSIHNMETKAATRAINRAISNLVGGGEVSAEEIQQGEENSTGEPVNTQNSAPSSDADFDADKKEPASPKQKNYIRNLMQNLGLKVDEKTFDQMTKTEASGLIEKYQQQMKERTEKKEASA